MQLLTSQKPIIMVDSITRQFVIISLHPEKGRRLIFDPYFNHALAGAVLMDFLVRGEIQMENRRITGTFRKNGENIHDHFAELIEKKPRPRKMTYWISRISYKSRFIFRETIASLASAGIINHERKYFINLIPYSRYYLTDRRYRQEIIEGLRNVLLHDRPPSTEQTMLIGLLKAAKATGLLVIHREEKQPLKRMSEKILKENELASEVNKSIRDIQAAIIASVAASAAAASHSSH